MGNVVKLARNKQLQESPQTATEQFIYLLGRPTLNGFLRFAKSEQLGEELMDPKILRKEWLAAQSYIQELEKTEAGCADGAVVQELPKRLAPLRKKLEADPVFQKSYDTLPTKIGMVELERLVVYQKHINIDFAAKLKADLGPKPNLEEVFRLALPYHHPEPPARWMKTHGDGYVFMSPSNDMRYLGSVVLKPSELTTRRFHGSVVGIVGLLVGFGSNFLNVVQSKNRLVLRNGSHRAYALRDLGVTHAPAIVQTIESPDDLRVADGGALRDNPELYLDNPRPSMLKDYFNPRLRKVVTVPRQVRQIRIEYETQEVFVPAL